jgi:hypothetical protein
MLIGQEWRQAFHRFIASPTLEVLAVAAVLGIALFSIVGNEPFSRSNDAHIAVFGPR